MEDKQNGNHEDKGAATTPGPARPGPARPGAVPPPMPEKTQKPPEPDTEKKD